MIYLFVFNYFCFRVHYLLTSADQMCAGRPLPFHGPLAKGAQLVEKSLAEFRVRRRESNTILRLSS